jgi:hypothetical protein
MSTGYVPTYFLGALMQKLVAVGTDAFKISLNTGTVPWANRDNATEYYGGADFASEAPATGTYVAGGLAVTLSQASYLTGSVHTWTAQIAAGSVTWAAATLTNITYAVLYDNTSATKWAACVWDFGGAQSVTANTFTINFTDTTPTGRVFYLSVS